MKSNASDFCVTFVTWSGLAYLYLPFPIFCLFTKTQKLYFGPFRSISETNKPQAEGSASATRGQGG